MPFVDQARQAFDFLVQEFGFLGPHIATGPAFLTLSYTGHHVGIAVEFDAREESVEVVMARLVDGEFPPRYEPVWVYLDGIARARGLLLQGGVTRPPRSEAEINDRIREEAELLRHAAPDVLKGDGSELEQYRVRYQARFPDS